MPYPPSDAREAGPRRNGVPPILEALMGQAQPDSRRAINDAARYHPVTGSAATGMEIQALLNYLHDENPLIRPEVNPHAPGYHSSTRTTLEERAQRARSPLDDVMEEERKAEAEYEAILEMMGKRRR